MNNGDGIAQTFTKHGARFHKACRNGYDDQKVARLSSSKETDDMETAEMASPCKTRSSLNVSDSKNSCIFCDVGAGTKKLVCVATLEIGPHIYAHAKELNDRKLLAKLTNTDLVAIEAKYHKSCYRQFLNRYRSYKPSKNAESSVHRTKKLTYGWSSVSLFSTCKICICTQRSHQSFIYLISESYLFAK